MNPGLRDQIILSLDYAKRAVNGLEEAMQWSQVLREAQALRNELAMCPESRVEMAAWQPECTSDLAYLDAPAVTVPATTMRWAVAVSALIWLGGGWALWMWVL